MSVIATVEDAIIASVSARLGNKVRGVESLAGPWTVDALKQALQFAPCVRVGFLGGDTTPDADVSIRARFGVYLIVGHALAAQRRRGAAQVIGLYDMLEAVAPALHEMSVPGVGSLVVRGTATAFAEYTLQMGGAVYALNCEMPAMVMPDADPIPALDAFVTFHADSDITGDGAPEIITEEALPQ